MAASEAVGKVQGCAGCQAGSREGEPCGAALTAQGEGDGKNLTCTPQACARRAREPEREATTVRSQTCLLRGQTAGEGHGLYCPLGLELPYTPRHPADTFSVTEDSLLQLRMLTPTKHSPDSILCPASLVGHVGMGLVEPQQGTVGAMPGLTSASSLVNPKAAGRRQGPRWREQHSPMAG